MAEYRLTDNGDLYIYDNDGDTTITPASDFPQILALIAPQAAPKPEAKPGPWYMDGDKLRYHGRRWHVCYNDTGADDAEICAWAVANQPEISADDLEFLTDGENSPSECAERLRETAPGVTPEQVQAACEPRLKISPELRTVSV